MTDIAATEIRSRLQSGEEMNLLDVREIIEFHSYNIGGKNIPLPALSNKLGDLDWDKSDEIIVICRAGLRSQTAQSILTLNGYKNIRNLTGGLLALQKIQ